MAIVQLLTIVITVQIHDDGRITFDVNPPPNAGTPPGGVIISIPAPATGSGGKPALPDPVVVSPEDVVANILRMGSRFGMGPREMKEMEAEILRQLGTVRTPGERDGPPRGPGLLPGRDEPGEF